MSILPRQLFQRNFHVLHVSLFFSGLIQINYRGGVSFKKQHYSNLPVVIKQYSFLMKISRKCLVIGCIWILFIRSFFIKDRTPLFLTFFVPNITFIFLSLSVFYPNTFSGFSACCLFVGVGIQLLVYDELGSRISFHVLYDIHPLFSITTLIRLKTNKNYIIRGVSSRVFKSLFIGETSMTATGYASLVVGATTGCAWLYNTYADLQAMNERLRADLHAQKEHAQADLHARDLREAKSRAYQNYQNSKSQYYTAPFYLRKGPEPEWDETHWEEWSKFE